MRAFTWAAGLLAASCLLLSGVPAVVSAAPEVQVADADTGAGFTAINPVRVLDTRNTSSPAGPGGVVELNLSSAVPAAATAVVLNVTATSGTATTAVTVYPHGAARPAISNLIVGANETRPNSATVAVGADRKVDLHNLSGSVHLIVDLDGYYAPATGAKYSPAQAERIWGDWNPAVGPGGVVAVDFTSRVPASATAVTFNLTGYEATAFSHVIAWPSGSPRPDTSNLNVAPGKDTPNFVTVGLGPDKKVQLLNAQGSTRLIVDFAGFYTPEFGAVFTPVAPRRLLDTRDGTGTWTGVAKPLGAHEHASVRSAGRVPDNAIAAVVNLTATEATGRTFLTAWQYHNIYGPWTSNLNVVPGQVVKNVAVIEINGGDSSSAFYIYNDVATTHAMADLTGYFWVPRTQCAANCAYIWGVAMGNGLTHSPGGTPVLQTGVADLKAATGMAALRTDGTVVAWGRNGSGELGNGWLGSIGTTMAVPVLGLNSVTAIASGDQNGYALRSDGTVWAWGSNSQGQLGDGGWDLATVPRPVPGLTGVKAIASGWQTAYALHQDGTVSTWGTNESGQLGIGSTAENVRVPTKIPGLIGVTAIAAGYRTAYAVASDQTVWSWGRNQAGQLGNGSTASESRVPVKVSGLTGVSAVAGDYQHGFAARSDGTAWAWGDASSGGLGNGVDCTECRSDTPVQVAGLTGVTTVAGFGGGGYAVRSDGSVWAWGNNGSSSLGDGTSGGFATRPGQVMGLPPVSAISGQYGARVIVPTR
jgi:hypothetical protein